MPSAYESALLEMTRRRMFRKMLDQHSAKLKQFIRDEKDKRADFHKHVHTYLPSSFSPGLKDQVPDFTIEGSASDYNYPVLDDIESKIVLISPIAGGSSDSN